MKQIITTILLCSIFISRVSGQDAKTSKKATFATKIIQNSVAGFYPIFFGNFETNKKFDITMYSIFWTNAAFGNQDTGGDLLLEVAGGLGFKLLDNKLYLNPSLGVSNGKFLSDHPNTKVGEGIIPSLYVNYNDRIIDFEGYLAYYKSIREDDNINTKDFVLNWLAPGVKLGNRVVLGAFYETLDISRAENGSKLQIYQWLGGSLKLKFDKGIAFRISAGKTLNTDVGQSDEFYKVSAFIPL